MIPAQDLARVLVEIADTLVDDFDLVEFLEMVTTRAAQLAHAAGAGLLLADQRGDLQLMAATAAPLKLLELFQLQTDDGPCLDCFLSGEPVVDTNLRRAANRWPRFAPAAVGAGYASVHAFPLRHRGRVMGALNLFSHDEGEVIGDDASIMQSLADVATIGLLQERAVSDGEILARQLRSALSSRVVIEQAKGMLARILDVDVDSAFRLLRSYSRQHGLRLAEVASAVVADPTTHPQLTTRR